MLDRKEERQYKRLRELAQELHIPVPEAFLTLEVFDKDGKLIQRHHQRSHSWTRNAYNAMFSNLASTNMDDVTFEAGKLSGKDTDGTVHHGDVGALLSTSSFESTDYGFRAEAGEDGWGILVGSGTNVESFEDFELQTQITEGTGAGQISHVESEAHSISYAGLVLKNTLIRYFNNNSAPAGDRNINEVVLCAKARSFGDAFVKAFVYSRDHLASTVTVPVTGQLKVTYTIQLTYPS